MLIISKNVSPVMMVKAFNQSINQSINQETPK